MSSGKRQAVRCGGAKLAGVELRLLMLALLADVIAVSAGAAVHLQPNQPASIAWLFHQRRLVVRYERHAHLFTA